MQDKYTGRQFSIGLLSFYTYCEQCTCCPWFQIIFSKMFIWKIALEDLVFLWSKGKVCLLSKVKGLGSLSSRFLSRNTIHSMCRCHLALFMVLYGNRHKKTLTLWSLLSLTNSFVSSPGISCLLPASMKLWQAN